MSYEETLAYIHSVKWQGSKPGLSRTRALLSALGNPEPVSYTHLDVYKRQLHVADFGGVVVQALHDELDVGAVQLQEPGPHHLMAVSYTHLAERKMD